MIERSIRYGNVTFHQAESGDCVLYVDGKSVHQAKAADFKELLEHGALFAAKLKIPAVELDAALEGTKAPEP